jgi:hypothetical protein
MPAQLLRWYRVLSAKRDREQSATRLPWAGPRLKNFFRARRPRAFPAVFSQRERVLQLASSPALMANAEHNARWEVATGLPTRAAYLDDSLALFLGRIPSGAIFAGARERGLLRESMENLVPDRVRYRMNKARTFEAHAELFEAMGGLQSVSGLLSMRELDRLGIVDGGTYRAYFERFAGNPRNEPGGWNSLWSALAAEAYVRWFRDFNLLANDSTEIELQP